jgi:hypothetical protein
MATSTSSDFVRRSMVSGFFNVQVNDYEVALQMFSVSDLESNLRSWKSDLEDGLFAADPIMVVLHRRPTSTT